MVVRSTYVGPTRATPHSSQQACTEQGNMPPSGCGTGSGRCQHANPNTLQKRVPFSTQVMLTRQALCAVPVSGDAVDAWPFPRGTAAPLCARAQQHLHAVGAYNAAAPAGGPPPAPNSTMMPRCLWLTRSSCWRDGSAATSPGAADLAKQLASTQPFPAHPLHKQQLVLRRGVACHPPASSSPTMRRGT